MDTQIYTNTVFLLTGGNQGNRLQYLEDAKNNIEKFCGQITVFSSIYETEAWGLKEQPSFYNQALQLQTNMPAEKLMQTLLSIEEMMGRIRTVKLGPRIIDIDILLFSDDIIESEILTVPHPFLHKRRFALTPLCEIAAEIIHPVFSKTIIKLLDECDDELPVYKIG